jgi:ribosomal protein L31E
MITIEFVSNPEAVQVQISNTLNKVVFSENIKSPDTNLNLNLSGLKNGIYFLRLRSTTLDEIRKIIIK